jgi:hypothetical protein
VDVQHRTRRRSAGHRRRPTIGLTTQPESDPASPSVILCYLVTDIITATARVREARGQSGTVEQRPYGMEARCIDDQGTPFYLHQFGQ